MRLFCNIYKRGIGGCIAYGYETLREAEHSMCGNREQLVVLTDEIPITPELEKRLRAYCDRRGKDPKKLLGVIVETFLNREAA